MIKDEPRYWRYWYSPKRILEEMTRLQICWCLHHYECLIGHGWPNNHATSYTQAPGHGAIKTYNSWEETSFVLGKVKERIESCEVIGAPYDDVDFLLRDIEAGKIIREMSPESKSVLYYCRGTLEEWNKRKAAPYSEWKRLRGG